MPSIQAGRQVCSFIRIMDTNTILWLGFMGAGFIAWLIAMSIAIIIVVDGIFNILWKSKLEDKC